MTVLLLLSLGNTYKCWSSCLRHKLFPEQLLMLSCIHWTKWCMHSRVLPRAKPICRSPQLPGHKLKWSAPSFIPDPVHWQCAGIHGWVQYQPTPKILLTYLSIIGRLTLSPAFGTGWGGGTGAVQKITSREAKVFWHNGTHDNYVYESQLYSCQKSTYGAMTTVYIRVIDPLMPDMMNTQHSRRHTVYASYHAL